MLKLQNGWIWSVQLCGRLWRNSMRAEIFWPTWARPTECPLPLTLQNTREFWPTECPLPLTLQNTREIRDETLAEAAEPWPPHRCEQIHHAPGIEWLSEGESLQDAASPEAYGHLYGHEGSNIQRNSPGDSRRHAADLRVRRRKELTSSWW